MNSSEHLALREDISSAAVHLALSLLRNGSSNKAEEVLQRAEDKLAQIKGDVAERLIDRPAIKAALDAELQRRLWALYDTAKTLCEQGKEGDADRWRDAERWADLHRAVGRVPESQKPSWASDWRPGQ